ncbi:cytochrome P450 [Sphingomonas radiodurans]|uniref:cytochrome P450 n=1 Tax=Sphingomonas radiodurans TaxID=2890321 RepID=UPI001E5F5233|nr:cytochrome P450 [Sphingomonas radiodurans]WBH17770.1 cytochrome P450 [Sphingomonas radiodurans]
MATAATLPDFFEPHVLEEPFDWYQQALARGPITKAGGGTVHLVLSHKLVSDAAGRHADFSSDFGGMMQGARGGDAEISAIEAEGWPAVNTMLTADPPVHTRFRKLVNLAFSMPRVNAMEAEIREIVDGLLDRLDGRDVIELVHEFAVPLPVIVIARQIGMVDAIDDVKRWSDGFADRLGGMADRARELECARLIVEFQQAVKRRIDMRRDGQGPDDLLGAIVNARIDGERPLDDAEIMSVVQQLMVAGNETTTSTLAGGLLLLIRNPDQLAKVQANPALIPNMVEEMLRLLSPTAGLWRVAAHDTELGGTPIAKGQMLMLRFAAANRDPDYFPEPDRFDVERKNARSHLAFGRGIHMCVGNMLSRKELAVAFERLLARYDRFELPEGLNDFRHAPNRLLRGLIKLNVTMHGRTPA